MTALFEPTDFKTEQRKLTVLSMGLGQDSTAILLKIIHDRDFREKYAPNDLLVVFADTGNEHPFTYSYKERVVEPLCKKHGIEFVSIVPDMGFHGKNWGSLEEQWEANSTIGSVAYPKTCTHRLKLNPQYNFVEKWISKRYTLPYGRKKGYTAFAKYYGKIEWLVGIAKGEESRVADADAETAQWKRKAVHVRYPLIEEGMDRTACQQYIVSEGYELPMPSNCMFCPFVGSNHMELLWLYKTYPDRFMEWVEHEERKLKAHCDAERNLGVTGKLHKEGDRKGEAFTLLDMLKEAEERYPNVTLEDLQAYKYSHGHCVGSKY